MGKLRAWTITVALTTLVVVLASRAIAQQHPLIGVLSPFVDANSSFLQDLRDGLADRGLREGPDILIEYRSADGHVEKLPQLAEELVRRKVNVIVTASAPAIRFEPSAG